MPTVKCAYKPCSREVVIHLKAEKSEIEKWNASKATTYCSTDCARKDAGEERKGKGA